MTVKERLNVKMIAGEEKVKCAWMIRHWHPHGCPYGYPSKCLQGTDIRTDVHNLWPVTWISARLSVWTIPCRVICATDSSTIFGMKGSDCCTSKHTPTTFFSSAIISSLSYFCRHLFMLSVFPLIGIYTLSFQVGIYTLSFQVWYRVTHVICAPNYFFCILLTKTPVGSEHLTADCLQGIPQTLRHLVFFTLFILPAMRLFTLWATRMKLWNTSYSQFPLPVTLISPPGVSLTVPACRRRQLNGLTVALECARGVKSCIFKALLQPY